MINNMITDLCQTIHIGLSGSKISAFYGVVKQPPDAVTVIWIVFSGIDTALGGDAVCATGAVLDTKSFNIVAQFRQGCRCRTTCQTGADHYDFKFSFVGRIDQFELEKMSVPFLCKGTSGNFCIKLHEFSLFLYCFEMRIFSL